MAVRRRSTIAGIRRLMNSKNLRLSSSRCSVLLVWTWASWRILKASSGAWTIAVISPISAVTVGQHQWWSTGQAYQPVTSSHFWETKGMSTMLPMLCAGATTPISPGQDLRASVTHLSQPSVSITASSVIIP